MAVEHLLWARGALFVLVLAAGFGVAWASGRQSPRHGGLVVWALAAGAVVLWPFVAVLALVFFGAARTMLRLWERSENQRWQFALGVKILVSVVVVGLLLCGFLWLLFEWSSKAQLAQAPGGKYERQGQWFWGCFWLAMSPFVVYAVPNLFAIALVVAGSDEPEEKKSLVRARFGSVLGTFKWVGLTFLAMLFKALADDMTKELGDWRKFVDDLVSTVVMLTMAMLVVSMLVMGFRLQGDLERMTGEARLLAAEKSLRKLRLYFRLRWIKALWFSDRSFDFILARAEKTHGLGVVNLCLFLAVVLSLPVSGAIAGLIVYAIHK